MSRPRIAVLGLGNLMRTDDAVGMLVLRELREDVRLPQNISLIDGGTLGLDLLHPLDGVTHLLAIDAVDAGAEPGTLMRFAGEEISELPISKSVHLLGFSDLVGAMRLTGGVPWEVVVLGVQPEVTGWGTELTPKVQRSLPELAGRAVEQVTQWMHDIAEGEIGFPLPTSRSSLPALDAQ